LGKKHSLHRKSKANYINLLQKEFALDKISHFFPTASKNHELRGAKPQKSP
jgi:hypothetical protein